MTEAPSPTPAPPAPTAELAEPMPDLRALFERQRAHRAQAARSTAQERLRQLARLGQLVQARRGELAAALRRDLGKSRAEAEVAELHAFLQELAHIRRHLARWMRPQRRSTPLSLLGSRSAVQFQPRGTVLVLSPWNYPLLLALSPLAGALAAGNTVILKPSEKAPHTSQALANLIAEAFDPALATVVTGGPEVAQALLELPFDHFFYTGGARVGRAVMRAASEHLASVTLELGGKSPAIVDERADLKLAAERIVWGKFLNAGQTCVAPDYVLVQERVQGALLLELDRAIQQQLGGVRWQRLGPDYGRLIDPAAVRRLEGLTRDSLAQGARLVTGGDFDAAARFISPTVLADVTPEMQVMREEIFGPLLPVLSYRRLDGALDLLRSGDPPLALYVFTQDARVSERVLRETRSGAAVVNGTVLHLSNPSLPFGGVGASGLGNYHGEASFRTFSHERAVMVEGRLSSLRLIYPPYGRLLPRFGVWLLRVLDRR